MTSIEFIQTIPVNILPYFVAYNNGKVPNFVKDIPKTMNNTVHIPNVMLIERVSSQKLIKHHFSEPRQGNPKFFEEFIRCLRATDWINAETKKSIAEDAIFILLLMINCSSVDMLKSYSEYYILSLIKAQKVQIVNRRNTYTEYVESAMEFLTQYYKGLVNLLKGDSHDRCTREIIIFLGRLYNLVKKQDAVFLYESVKLLGPPSYLTLKLKKRLCVLFIIPELTKEIFYSLPSLFRLSTSDMQYLQLFSSKKMNFQEYNLLMDSLPSITNSNNFECIADFNKVLWAGHTSKELKKQLIPGQSLKVIENFHKKDLLKQLITFLLPNYYLFWKKNNWNNNLEVQRRIRYLKNTIMWKPDTKKLTKYILYN